MFTNVGKHSSLSYLTSFMINKPLQAVCILDEAQKVQDNSLFTAEMIQLSHRAFEMAAIFCNCAHPLAQNNGIITQPCDNGEQG